jgi:cell fate regulator YaaT (PSP1 superfamily)
MNYIEIQFQGNRRRRYLNPHGLPFKLDDHAVVETEKGENMGRVVALGEVDEEEEKRLNFSVLRKAGKPELARRERMREREEEASEAAIQRIREHKLPMKLVSTEYQLDGRKVTFYFTAEGRVDFRGLVKDLAAALRTRIELRQIGARDESRKVPGFGACGCQLCCNTFLSHFDPITTQMAKKQNLPLNPAKLSGNCGRLRCCLQYEMDFYVERMREFPRIGYQFRCSRGKASILDVDIFQETIRLRFLDGDEETVTLHEYHDLNCNRCAAENNIEEDLQQEDSNQRAGADSDEIINDTNDTNDTKIESDMSADDQNQTGDES